MSFDGLCAVCRTAPNSPHMANHCTSCWDLLAAAEEALTITRREGVPKYGPDTWKEVSSREHLDHAIAHIQLYYGSDHTDEDEDHLAHAICRLVMARALQEK